MDNFDEQFSAVMAEEQAAADAVATPAAKKPKKEKKEKAPKTPRVKLSEGAPNKWGITLKRTGVVITDTYLRKWAQCASRGYKFNRSKNIDIFMSDAWITENGLVGKTTAEYCAAVQHSELWRNPETGEHPCPPKVAKVKVEKPPKVKKQKATPALPMDEATAAAISGDIPVEM